MLKTLLNVDFPLHFTVEYLLQNSHSMPRFGVSEDNEKSIVPVLRNPQGCSDQVSNMSSIRLLGDIDFAFDGLEMFGIPERFVKPCENAADLRDRNQNMSKTV